MNYSTEDNIEDRIKSIIQTKLQNNEFKNSLDDNKMEIIEKLFEIFPDLKDQTKFIDNNNNNNNQSGINVENDNSENEIVLSEFQIMDKTYYKDKYGGMWNDNAEIIGTSKKNDTDGNPICVFFDQNFVTYGVFSGNY